MEQSASLSSTFKSQHSEVVKIQTVKLDDFWKEAGRDTVSVMKIDVEGVEEKVLCGAAELMARDKPIIFCEILPNSSGWEVIPTILAKLGYLRAAINTNYITVQRGSEPDLCAHNYILFPLSLEPIIRDVACSVNVQYRS